MRARTISASGWGPCARFEESVRDVPRVADGAPDRSGADLVGGDPGRGSTGGSPLLQAGDDVIGDGAARQRGGSRTVRTWDHPPPERSGPCSSSLPSASTSTVRGWRLSCKLSRISPEPGVERRRPWTVEGPPDDDPNEPALLSAVSSAYVRYRRLSVARAAAGATGRFRRSSLLGAAVVVSSFISA